MENKYIYISENMIRSLGNFVKFCHFSIYLSRYLLCKHLLKDYYKPNIKMHAKINSSKSLPLVSFQLVGVG